MGNCQWHQRQQHQQHLNHRWKKSKPFFAPSKEEWFFKKKFFYCHVQTNCFKLNVDTERASHSPQQAFDFLQTQWRKLRWFLKNVKQRNSRLSQCLLNAWNKHNIFAAFRIMSGQILTHFRRNLIDRNVRKRLLWKQVNVQREIRQWVAKV